MQCSRVLSMLYYASAKNLRYANFFVTARSNYSFHLGQVYNEGTSVAIILKRYSKRQLLYKAEQAIILTNFCNTVV